MNGIRLLLITLIAFLSYSPAFAETFPDNPSGFVTDMANLFSPDGKAELEGIISDFEGKTKNEIAVLTINSTDGEPIENYAIKVFDKWKIGKKGLDNGVLFLVAIKDRKLFMATGYGVEGVLPDGKVGEIRDRYVIPYFKKGAYQEGIKSGVMAIASTLSNEAMPEKPSSKKSKIKDFILLPLVLIVILFSLISQLGSLSGYGSYSRGRRYYGGGGFSGFGGGSSGGFGGFGGGMSGGGGAGGSW